MELSQLWVSIGAKIDDLTAGLRRAQAATDSAATDMANDADRVKDAWGGIGDVIAGALSGAGLLAFGKTLADTANSVESNTKKISLVFGQAESAVMKWADANAAGMGMTAKEAAALSATVGASFKAIGFSAEEVAKKSTQVTELAAALSSWTNGELAVADAQAVVAAAMRGETDSIQELGYIIDQDIVKSELARLGKDKLTGAALKQAEAEAVLSVLMGQSADKMEAYAATSGSVATKQAEISASLKEVTEDLATAFLPAIQAVLDKVAEAADWFANLDPNIKVAGAAIAMITGAIMTLIPVVGMMTSAIGTIKPAMLAASTAVRGAMVSIGAAIGGAMLPITLVVAAVAGLYLAYKNNFLGIRDFLKPMVDNIVKIIGQIVEGIRFVVYNADTLWKGFVQTFKLTVGFIGEIVKSLGSILSGVGLVIYGAFIEPWKPVFNSLNTVANNIGNGLRTLVENIKRILQPVFNILLTLGIAIGQGLQNALNAAGSFITNIFGDAANQIAANAEAAAKESSTVSKGVEKIKAGVDDAADAWNDYKAAVAGVGKETQANLKTPPKVQVPNAALPKPPANTYKPTAPSFLAGYGVEDPKDSKKGGDKPYKATEADVKSLSTAITRLIEDQKRQVASGKMTEDQAIAYKRAVEDTWTQIDKLNLENNKYVVGLYNQAKGHVANGFAAAKAAAAAAAQRKENEKAAEAARKKEAADKAANEAVKVNATVLTRLLEAQKRAVAQGTLTEQQAISYKQRIEDITATINKQGIANNSLIKMLLGQATAYVDVAMKAGVANDATRKNDAALNSRLSNMKSAVKEMTDAELASKEATIEASNDYGKAKLLEVIRDEQSVRAKKAAKEAAEEYAKVTDRLTESIKKLNAATADSNLSTEKLNLESEMEAAIAAADGNESAILEIKERYAPKFLALEIKKINSESEARLAALDEMYAEDIAAAQKAGVSTLNISLAYQRNRQAISDSANAQIKAATIKSANDTSNAKKAIEKKNADEAVKLNSDAAKDIADAYIAQFDGLSTQALTDLIPVLEGLQAGFLAMGEAGVEAAGRIGVAIEKLYGTRDKKADDAAKELLKIPKTLDGMDAELSDLLLDPDSKEAFIKNGLQGFDSLIDAYDELITSAEDYITVLEGAGRFDEANLYKGVLAGVQAKRQGVVDARGTRSTELGNKFDADAKDKTDKENAEKAKASLQVDNNLKTNQITLATEVADFKLKKIEDEKAAKLSLAKTDKERADIELSYVQKIKDAQLEANRAREAAALEALRQEEAAALAVDGLTDAQKAGIKAYYAEKNQLVKDGHAYERTQIEETSAATQAAQKKALDGWKDLLLNFVKDTAAAITNAYATIYENNRKLAEGNYATPEDFRKAQEDAAKANGEAAKNAGLGVFNAAVAGLKAVFPQFAIFIDMIGGLLSNMPQLGIVFQRIGEIFLVLMDVLAPVIELLATVLEPLLNILKVLLEAIIKPLLPILTFFLKVTAAIITAIYNVIKTVWNAIASFLNSINLFGWKPFNMSLLPELESNKGNPTPNVGSGATGSTGSNTTGGSNSTSTNSVTNVFYINEASDTDKVVKLVMKNITKSLA